MPKASQDYLSNTIGHQARLAFDAIAGKPTGNLNSHGRVNNTFRLNYANDIEGMTPEQDSFIMELIKFEREHRRKPELIDAFRIAKSMGYRRVA